MLYCIFNNRNSLREVATGVLASEQRLSHIGMCFLPRRSTISDANNRRQAKVFGEIYYTLYNRYASFLSDSGKNSRASKLYIYDATTISLFQEVLRTSGKRKGGIKVHTLIRSDQDVPCMMRYSAASPMIHNISKKRSYLRVLLLFLTEAIMILQPIIVSLMMESRG